ncbi:MAG: flagellar hook-length control protein FliK, partial [Candidatus Hydrogenedentes bacterium]|nr:flagellar hook-length control protein FliK [Candidatus Hydrogenedentota bacterium]
LAQLVLSGSDSDVQAALRESLYVQLTQLRANQKLSAFLKGTGRLGAFETAVDGLLEQLRGGDVQRMSASEIPYQLIELPLHPQSGFERAQVHFFGEENNTKQGGSPGTSLVVFDLSLSRLGDMWITLRTTQKTCTCRIETVDPNAAAMIEEHSEELANALAEAGYPGAVVESAAWEGDRLAAVADLFRGVSGLDISA